MCSSCGQKVRAKKGDYNYVGSGLTNVVLKGIELYYCPACGEVSPKIPKVKGLHRAIAKGLIEKTSLLTGEEIRFLRKEMGLRAKALAEVMGVDKVTVSRWETGSERISTTADRAIRLLYQLSELYGAEDVVQSLAHIRKQQQVEKLTIKPVASKREALEWAVA